MKKYRRLRLGMMIAFGISGLVLNVIPYIDRIPEDVRDPVSYAVAGVFWFGFLAGVILILCEHIGLREMRQKAFSKRRYETPRFPGFMSVTTQTANLLILAAFVIGFIILITDLFLKWIPGEVFFPVLTITYYLFCIHSVIDGKNDKAYRILREIKASKKAEKKLKKESGQEEVTILESKEG